MEGLNPLLAFALQLVVDLTKLCDLLPQRLLSVEERPQLSLPETWGLAFLLRCRLPTARLEPFLLLLLQLRVQVLHYQHLLLRRIPRALVSFFFLLLEASLLNLG